MNLKNIKKNFILLEKLYKEIDGKKISLLARQKLNIKNAALTYGEIHLASLATCLNIVKPKTDEIFFDLGSGVGKAVFCAALLNNWKKCYGVEIISDLYRCSESILTQLKAHSIEKDFFPHNIEFIHADILKTDFSEGDVIYINATVFSPDFWNLIIQQFKKLKIGARIITLTKKLPHDDFELIEETALPMSWGTNSVFIYLKIN